MRQVSWEPGPPPGTWESEKYLQLLTQQDAASTGLLQPLGAWPRLLLP